MLLCFHYNLSAMFSIKMYVSSVKSKYLIRTDVQGIIKFSVKFHNYADNNDDGVKLRTTLLSLKRVGVVLLNAEHNLGRRYGVWP